MVLPWFGKALSNHGHPWTVNYLLYLVETIPVFIQENFAKRIFLKLNTYLKVVTAGVFMCQSTTRSRFVRVILCSGIPKVHRLDSIKVLGTMCNIMPRFYIKMTEFACTDVFLCQLS